MLQVYLARKGGSSRAQPYYLPGLPIPLVSFIPPPPLATAHVSALLGHFLAPLAAQGALLRYTSLQLPPDYTPPVIS